MLLYLTEDRVMLSYFLSESVPAKIYKQHIKLTSYGEKDENTLARKDRTAG